MVGLLPTRMEVGIMIDFMKYRFVYFAISMVVIVPGVIALFVWGLQPAIDFTGGTLLEVEIDQAYRESVGLDSIEQVAIQNGIEVSSIQTSGEGSYLLRAKPFDQALNTLFQERLASESGVVTVSAIITEKRFETLGPTLGRETLIRALTALGIAALVILLFVWKQFNDKKYGICAIVAMLHDSLITFGIFAILGYFYGVEIDTLFMTAVLTILSFSVHDTIVVYDRIRESLRKLPGESYERILNKAVNETLVRSINNSMTIIFMLLALFLLGGETIRWFVLALLIGTISGTYSSSFVAAPLLLVWDKVFGKK